MAKRDLLQEHRRKIQPKLQMMANGDSTVNAVRAEHMSCITATSDRLLSTVPLRQTGNAPVSAKTLGGYLRRHR